MKSRITIEVDFQNGNLPVIQVLSRPSSDVRDGLIKQFLQSLAHTSRWATITYAGTINPDEDGSNYDRWVITPITPNQIPQEIKLMQATEIHTSNF